MTLRVINFISNRKMHVIQKFKMTAKNGGKMIFGKNWLMTCIPLEVENFIKITLSHTASEIKAFLCFTQKFKMADIFGKN